MINIVSDLELARDNLISMTAERDELRLSAGAAQNSQLLEEFEQLKQKLRHRNLWLGLATDSGEYQASPIYTAAPAKVPECQWSLFDDESGTWRSSCGELWSFIDGGPSENRVVYCHHCGGKVMLDAAPKEAT